MKNPFEFKYPDDIDPQDVIDLFVPVFGEYYNIPNSGHTFINGARGSGKSMMLRYMKPDCQVLINSDGEKSGEARKVKDLDYFAIYIPIKKGHLNKTDIQLNNKHGEAILNEHFMVTQFSITIFKELSEADFQEDETGKKAFRSFFNGFFRTLLRYSGYKLEAVVNDSCGFADIFASILNILREISSSFQHDYLKKLIGSKEPLAYNGPIFLYADFLYELLKEFRKLPFMPDTAIYLLIDDADEMNLIQRKILNSWVSLRTSKEVSLKISTQLKYKIFSTINDSRIDTPHDYSEVNLNDIYTTKKDLYYKRIKEIVSKRLAKFCFENTDPELFFPPDAEQEKQIDKKRLEYKEMKLAEGLSDSQASDFAYRYAIPDFIKGLEGNRYTFSYAGFRQLVNISSGIIREYIDFASEMFVAQSTESNGKEIKLIDPKIQDSTIKKYSDFKIEKEFDKYRDEAENKGDMDKLRNLIMGLGGLFSVILNSDTSERRVFSVALNDEPDEELRGILDLGVQLGYLQKSMIGNKYGTGKARLYIMNRTLAPHFKLDPSSFAGYKFMNAIELKKSMSDPKKFIERFKSNIKGANKDNGQGTLFIEE